MLLLLPVIARSQYISTICGNENQGYNGDGGPAKYAEIYAPEGFCHDKYSNIYIADAGNCRIRKIDAATGIITTVAGKKIITTAIGTDTLGFSGDGGLATDAALFFPDGVWVDTVGNLYIADAENNRIRKVAKSTGVITTVVGSGPAGSLTGSYSGDGGLATDATLNEPNDVCVDNFGNIYIADYTNNRIRKVEASSGIITTIAGNGTTSYGGGLAVNTGINGAINVSVDTAGNVFFSDQYNFVVRRIDAITGAISTIAGNGKEGLAGQGDGGLAVNAELISPSGIFIDKFYNFFIADYGGAIRKIDAITGIITTVAGNGNPGYSGDGGLATNAQIIPTYVFLDNCGTMYIADYGTNTIRMVSYAGVISGPSTSICQNIFALIDSLPNGKWSSSNTAIATIDAASGTIKTQAAGTTIITYATDSNAYGCISTATYPVIVGLMLSALGIISPAKCAGDNNGAISVMVKGDAGPFDYSWSNGDSVNSIGHLVAGMYSLQVEDDSTLCIFTDSFAITQPDSLLITAKVTNENCSSGDGSISVAVSGGTAPYSYSWSNSTTGNNSTGLSAGTYSVVVTDTSKCSQSISVTITDTCDRKGLYPNPTTSQLTISYGSTINNLSIINILGQNVFHDSYNASKIELDVTFLSAGLYFAIINGSDVWRFVKK
jgi:hypothetical protein